MLKDNGLTVASKGCDTNPIAFKRKTTTVILIITLVTLKWARTKKFGFPNEENGRDGGKVGRQEGELDRKDVRWAGVKLLGGLGRFLFGLKTREEVREEVEKENVKVVGVL